jgi:hypothetical protein
MTSTRFTHQTTGGMYRHRSILQMKKGLENSCKFTLGDTNFSDQTYTLDLVARYYADGFNTHYHVTNMERKRLLKEIAKLGL